MDTIARLAAYGAKVKSSIRFIGVPKTIDNDLMFTDHTPGYGKCSKVYCGNDQRNYLRFKCL